VSTVNHYILNRVIQFTSGLRMQDFYSNYCFRGEGFPKRPLFGGAILGAYLLQWFSKTFCGAVKKINWTKCPAVN